MAVQTDQTSAKSLAMTFVNLQRLIFLPLLKERWKSLQIHMLSFGRFQMIIAIPWRPPPDAVIFHSYDADSFKTIPLPPLHEELVEDDKTVVDSDDDDDVDGDDEDLDPHWQLPDDEKLLSGNDTVLSDHELPPEDEFEKGSPDSEKNFLCLAHVSMIY